MGNLVILGQAVRFDWRKNPAESDLAWNNKRKFVC